MIITTPESSYPNSYNNLVSELYDNKTQVFPEWLLKNIIQGDAKLLKFIIGYCTSSNRYNLIYFLYNKGYAGKTLSEFIFKKCNGDHTKLDSYISRIVLSESFSTSDLHRDETYVLR